MIPARERIREFESNSLLRAVDKYLVSRENLLKMRIFGLFLADVVGPYRFSGPFLDVKPPHSLKILCP